MPSTVQDLKALPHPPSPPKKEFDTVDAPNEVIVELWSLLDRELVLEHARFTRN